MMGIDQCFEEEKRAVQYFVSLRGELRDLFVFLHKPVDRLGCSYLTLSVGSAVEFRAM